MKHFKEIRHLSIRKGTYDKVLCKTIAGLEYCSDPYWVHSHWNKNREAYDWCDVCVMLLLAKQGENT